MTDKFEVLSQPAAYDYNYAGVETCEGFGLWRNELSRERPPGWMIDSGKVKDIEMLYSQEYVAALLSELEETRSTLKSVTECWNDECQRNKELGQREKEQGRTVCELFDEVKRLQQSNAELKQRLRQPIKLPQRKAAYASGYGDGYLVSSDGGDCFDRDDVIEALQQQGFKVEGDAE